MFLAFPDDPKAPNSKFVLLRVDLWGEDQELDDLGLGLIERTGEVHFARNPKIDPYLSARAERWFREYFAKNLLRYPQRRHDGGPITPEGVQRIWCD